MTRSLFFLIFFTFLLSLPSLAIASEPVDFPWALKSRKVIGVIYFNSGSGNLSRNQRTEIDRIAAQVMTQISPEKIVRVEGFTSRRAPQSEQLAASLSRAKSVWHYLEKMEPFNSSNLYLTGFSTPQSFSSLQGERVEIAIYVNPFKEKTEIYSSN
ncbi:MAG: OmpA family protein [Desulfuromonadales bacterium]|nr:OmpA family protein [Desulfuromonadales bacterium]